MKRLYVLVFTLFSFSCSSESHIANRSCGELPDVSSFTSLEKKVVEDAMKRNTEQCGSDFSGCAIALQKDEKFIVRFQTRIFDPHTGKCAAMVGGTWFEKYREDGGYERTLHSF